MSVTTKTYADQLRDQLSNKYGLRFYGGQTTVEQLVERIQKDGLTYTMTWGGQFTDALKNEMVEQAKNYINTDLVAQEDDDELIRLLDLMVIHGSHFGVSGTMGIPQRPMEMMIAMTRDEVLAEAKKHLIQSAGFALAAIVREEFKDEFTKVRNLKDEFRNLAQKYDRARSDATREKLLDEIDTVKYNYIAHKENLKLGIEIFVKGLDNLPKILNPEAALSYDLQSI